MLFWLSDEDEKTTLKSYHEKFLNTELALYKYRLSEAERVIGSYRMIMTKGEIIETVRRRM